MLITIMSQNIKYGAAEAGRLDGLFETVRTVAPDLLLLQECDDLADPQGKARAAQALGMELEVAPSLNLPVAVAWNPARLTKLGTETKYWNVLHHGYCSVRFDVNGLPEPLGAPLVAISTHLTPYSAPQASQEAALLGARLYRYAGVGLLGGDINHPPCGDPEPDWSKVQPYNRMARCVRRSSPDEPWRADTIVGQTLRDGDLTDVAAYLADTRDDMALRVPTGKAGLIRTDQIHVTPALVPAIHDYRLLESEFSDHHGLLATFDLAQTDRSRVRQYT